MLHAPSSSHAYNPIHRRRCTSDRQLMRQARKGRLLPLLCFDKLALALGCTKERETRPGRNPLSWGECLSKPNLGRGHLKKKEEGLQQDDHRKKKRLATRSESPEPGASLEERGELNDDGHGLSRQDAMRRRRTACASAPQKKSKAAQRGTGGQGPRRRKQKAGCQSGEGGLARWPPASALRRRPTTRGLHNRRRWESPLMPTSPVKYTLMGTRVG